MNAIVAERKYTPEDLLHMPDGDRYELVDGQLVEREMSAWSSYVAGRIHRLVGNFCEPLRLGWTFPEGTSYQCFPDAPAKVRKPDVSFIRRDRLSPAQATAEGHITIAPDAAVEVISPNDMIYEVDRRVRELLNAGTQLVWVVNPDVKAVQVLRADGTGVILNENDTLSGENVIPGFSCKVAEFFVMPV